MHKFTNTLTPAQKDLIATPSSAASPQPDQAPRRQEGSPLECSWTILLAAAARITSLSDACQRLRDAPPTRAAARQALLATLPDYAELQRQLNAALAGHLPKAAAQAPPDGWPST